VLNVGDAVQTRIRRGVVVLGLRVRPDATLLPQCGEERQEGDQKDEWDDKKEFTHAAG
jgi:hypothetical protein